MTKQTARIENWWVEDNPSGSKSLCGEVHDHPVQSNGTIVRTSRILHVDETKVETVNTVYTLGKEATEETRIRDTVRGHFQAP